MTKQCSKCGGCGPFHKDRTKKDGLRGVCKSCVHAYTVRYHSLNRDRNREQCKAWRETHTEAVVTNNRRWYQNHREAEIVRTAALAKANRSRVNSTQRVRAQERKGLIISAKSEPCVDCGVSYPPYCMDFDHVRGEKRVIIAWMAKYSAAAVLAEIAKCDLVCANCHRIRTDNRRPRTNNKRRRGFAERMLPFKTKPCSDCCVVFSPFVMEFDHVRGEKKSCIARMRCSPWPNVLAEIAKCDLVCACCHRKRTHERKAA